MGKAGPDRVATQLEKKNLTEAVDSLSDRKHSYTVENNLTEAVDFPLTENTATQ